MRHSYFFKSLLLLCAVMVGSVCAKAEATWVKTAADSLVTGDVVVIVDQTTSTAMPNDYGKDGAPSATEVTLTDDKSEISGEVPESLQWIVTADNGSFQFGVEEDFLFCNNTNNGVRVGTKANNWFTIKKDPSNDNVGFLYNTATDRYIGVYNSQDWRCYTSINANISGCVTAFYKMVGGTPPRKTSVTTIDYSGITNINVFAGTEAGRLSATVTVHGTPIDAIVTWESDNEEVATISESGVVTLVAAGFVEFTASFEGDDGNKPSLETYTMTVVNIDPTIYGTADNPFTVADAMAYTSSGSYDADAEFYVKGIVSEFYKGDIVSDGSNFRYYISDDNTSWDQMMVFKGSGLEKAAFQTADDLQIGDEVTVCGKLNVYRGHPEIGEGNYLVAWNRPETPVFEKVETFIVFTDSVSTGEVGDVLPWPIVKLYDEDGNELEDKFISLSSMDESVATLEEDGIHLLKPGITFIIGSFAGDDHYLWSWNSYELRVTGPEPPPAEIPNPYKYEFTSIEFTEANTLNLADVNWALDTDAGYFGYDKNKGQQIGSGNKPATTLTLSTSDIPYQITAVRVNSSGGSGINGTVSVKVGESDFLCNGEVNAPITKEAANYDFFGDATGTIVISFTQTSSKAFYIRLIEVNSADATGIRTVDANNMEKGVIYNFAGQRVENPTKGMFIIDGKKVVIKQ